MKFKLPASTSRFLGRASLIAQQNSPTILLTVGLVGGVVATVMACKATLRMDEVVSSANIDKDLILNRPTTEDYNEIDRGKDLARVRLNTISRTIKLYSPAVAVGMFSAGCIIGGHRILTTRNAAMVSAYAALEKSFNRYRDRVIEELGPEKEQEIRFGTEVKETKDEDGNHTFELKRDGKPSPYAVFYDESAKTWSRAARDNQIFLRMQQTYMNDLLKTRGHVFLNEVYDALGLPRTEAGQFVGWVDGNADSYIDFGVFEGDLWSAMRFVNGDERTVLLDFNVDGPIAHLLKEIEKGR